MKQEKEDKGSSEKIISFVLMGLGVLMMGGIGFSILMESLGDLE
jgi:preprotein translocase subunit Sss1